MHQVNDDQERQQQGDGLPGPAFAPLQAMGEHQQQQPGEHVRDARDVRQRAGHVVADLMQVAVHVEAGQHDLDDVGQPDEQGQPRRRHRHPGPLVPPVGRTANCPRGGRTAVSGGVGH